MMEEGLRKARRAKKPPAHQMRERRACYGELIQMDGSDHTWFEERGPRCTLLVYIDDATGKLMELWFVPDETTFAYFEPSRHYFERYGKPVAFYSDKHGIFRVTRNKRLVRVTIDPVWDAHAKAGHPNHLRQYPSSQRTDRTANQTLQDRLVKELVSAASPICRLGTLTCLNSVKISTAVSQFSPRSTYDTHRPLLKTENLDIILTHQKTGTLSKNLTVQANKIIYQYQTARPDYALRKAKVTVCENAKGEVTILYDKKPLSYSIYQKTSPSGRSR